MSTFASQVADSPKKSYLSQILLLSFVSELENYRRDRDKENIVSVGNAKRPGGDKTCEKPDSKFASYFI